MHAALAECVSQRYARKLVLIWLEDYIHVIDTNVSNLLMNELEIKMSICIDKRK